MAGDLNFTVDFQSEAARRQIDELWNKFKAGSQEAGDALNKLLGGTVQKKVRITLERDDSGVKQLKTEVVSVKSELDKLTRAYAAATKVQPLSITNLRQSITEARQARDAIARFGAEVDILNKKQVFNSKQTEAYTAAAARVQDLEAKLKNLELAGASAFTRLSSAFGVDTFLKFGQSLQNIVTIFQSLGIAVAAVTSPIRALTGALSDLQSFALAFKAVGVGAGQSANALAETQRIALGLGANLDTVRTAFQKLSPVILNSGGTLNDVGAITESLSSRFVAFGLSADQSRRVMNGVIQAFAKGKLMAEELTQQISEADPAFKTDFARALLISKDSLGALGQEVDGTTTGLEKLVKAGRITSDVLIKVIPQLSKSSILFGKLGSSATSAVQALKRGDVTLKQVQSNIQSLNQLSLERLAGFAKPLIYAILQIEASVTDFITSLSKLQITKDLISILTSFANAFGRVTDFILKGAEGISYFLGFFTPLLSALAKIPGVLEVVSAAFLTRLINPVKKATAIVGKLKEVIAGVSAGPVEDLDVVNVEKTQKDLKILRAELGKGVESGLEKTVGKSLDGVEGSIDKLTKKQQKARKKLEDELTGLKDSYGRTFREIQTIQEAGGSTGVNDELGKVRTRINEIEDQLKSGVTQEFDNASNASSRLTVSMSGFSDEIKNAVKNIGQLDDSYLGINKKLINSTNGIVGGFVDNETLDQLDRLAKADPTAGLKLLQQVQQNLINQRARFQDALDMDLLPPQMAADARTIEQIFEKYDADIAKVSKSIDGIDLTSVNADRFSQQVNRSTVDTAALRAELARLQEQERQLGAAAGKNLRQLTGELNATKREIKRVAKELLQVGEQKIKTDIQLPTSQYQEAIRLAKSYGDAAINSQTKAVTGSYVTVQALEQEVQALKKKKNSWMALLQSQDEYNTTSGQVRDQLDSVSRQLEAKEKELFRVRNATAEGVRGWYDYNEALKALDGGLDTTGISLTKFKSLIKVVGNALDAVGGDYRNLMSVNKKLTDEIDATLKKLGTKRSIPLSTSEIDNLKATLANLKSQLRDNEAQLENTKNAARILDGQLDTLTRGAIEAGDGLERTAKAGGALGRLRGVFEGLAGSSNRWVSAFGTLVPKAIDASVNAFKSLSNTIRAFSGEIIIFALIATATAAYGKAMENTKRIQEETKTRTEELSNVTKDLKESYKALTGAASEADLEAITPKLSGVDTVLISLGNAINYVTEAFKNLINTASGGLGLDKFGNEIKQATSGVQKFLAVLAFLGGGALAGAIAGGGVGAAIGVLAASITLIVAAGNQAKATLEEIAKSGAEVRKGIQQEVNITKQLIQEVANYGNAYAKAREEREASGGTDASVQEASSLAKLTVGYNQLIKTKQGFEARLKQTTALIDLQITSLANNFAEARKLEAALKKLEDTKGIKTPTGTKYVNPEDKKAADDLTAAIAALSVKATTGAAVLQQLRDTKAKLAAEAIILKQQIEFLRQKYGLLSEEELKTANNLENLTNKMKEQEAALALLDYDKQRDQFNSIAQSIGVTKAAMERLEAAAEGQRLKGYIEELARQLASGEIPASLNNIDKLVQALEQRSLTIDVNSPELPKVIEALNQAREKADQLNNKKATITVELIQQGMENGTLSKTLANYDRLIEALNQKKITTPVDSAGYNQLLEQIRDVSDKRKMAEMTTDDLMERKYNIQKERIDIIANLEKMRHEQKIKQIDREIDAVTRFYDKQIKALEKQRGPAETALAALKKQELEEKASKGGREGLEARAELERMAREEKIAALQEEKAKKLEALEEKKRAISEQMTERELAVAEQRYELEQKIAALRLKALEREEAQIDQTLSERTNSDDSGDAARERGKKDGEAYNNAFQMSIRAGSLEDLRNLPGAKVKFDIDDAGVKNAYREYLVLEDQYTQALTKRQQLNDQMMIEAQKPPMEQNSAVAEAALQHEQELLRLGAERDAAQERFNQRLQETKQVTGDIVLTNENLNSQLQSTSQLPTPFDPVRITEANAAVQELTAAFQSQQQVVGGLKEEISTIQDPTLMQQRLAALDQENAKLGEIGTQLQGAKLYYEELNTAANGVGQADITPEGLDQVNQSSQQTKENFDGVNQAVQNISAGAEVAAGNLQGVSQSTDNAAGSAEKAGDSFSKAGQSVREGLLQALEAVPAKLDNIRSQMASIFEKDYTINVTLNVAKQGVWTGGPVTKGTAYTVNELGQEGFMNSFGRISPIQKPRYGTWRAPSSGFVIPADIYSQIKQNSASRPSNEVKYSNNTSLGAVPRQRRSNDMTRMMVALVNRLNDKSKSNDLSEMAKVQAHQAKEIGKLSRAIESLNDKDWNVRVGVKNSNNASYLKTLNYRM